MKKIKVLIVDDSKLIQAFLSSILTTDHEIEVVGTAADPLIARDLIKKLNPDVLTLDIMLPHMDGITFLKNLMRLHPMPVIMVSSLTESGSALALEALANGAVDYLQKPLRDQLVGSSNFSKDLIALIKTAAKANIAKAITPLPSKIPLQNVISNSAILKQDLIVIGASTGGIEAIETILLQLPQTLPPVIVVQHIRKEFNLAFSKRIQKLYGLSVIVPDDHSEILPGNIYIAPAEHHLVLKKYLDHYKVTYEDDIPNQSSHKPSIDVLFNSVAKIAGPQTIGILLTGMGTDGAEGLKAIHDAGGTTIAQDQTSSVVWGMPGAAVKLNAADFVLSIDQIPQKILEIIDSKTVKIPS